MKLIGALLLIVNLAAVGILTSRVISLEQAFADSEYALLLARADTRQLNLELNRFYDESSQSYQALQDRIFNLELILSESLPREESYENPNRSY